MAQMVLASGNQLKPFIIVTLYRFCSNNFPEKSIPKPPGYVHGHGLLLEVYGTGHGPDGPGLQKPTQTIHYYHPLQVLFQQLS